MGATALKAALKTAGAKLPGAEQGAHCCPAPAPGTVRRVGMDGAVLGVGLG